MYIAVIDENPIRSVLIECGLVATCENDVFGVSERFLIARDVELINPDFVWIDLGKSYRDIVGYYFMGRHSFRTRRLYLLNNLMAIQMFWREVS